MGLIRSSQGGEIVQVQGGHIIRATGRKDRHSKVFTAKGPRDRRVRLAAHTAIQFYDVQDRLGYDRPSKAVDWLINKAKASIDKLAELPPWDPTTDHSQNNGVDENNHNVGGSNQMSLAGESGDNSLGTSQFYVPQCVDTVSQSLGDSMKSFFPTNASQENNSFQNYPHQDLCLSLHSTLHDSGASVQSAHQSHPGHDQSLFHGGFDGEWVQHQDVGRFTRLMGWVGDSSGIGGGGGEGRGGLMFANSPSLMSTQALLLNQPGSSTMANFCHNNQRGTLQSSYSHLPRVFEDSQSHNLSSNPHHQSINGIGHGSDSFMGLYITSQMNGDLHGGASMSNRASASSLSPDNSTQH